MKLGCKPTETVRAKRKQKAGRGRQRTSAYRQYVMHIREADRLIAEYRTPIALKILEQERSRPGEPDLREFSWHYLHRRCHTERRTLTGHRGDVHHVEFSPRGDLLASAGKNGTVRLWNTTTWQQVRTIPASLTEVNVAAFSPDGQTLATVDDEGKLKLWDTTTGDLQLEKLAHNGEAVIARFTSDGKTVITGGRKDGFIKLWDRRTGFMRDSFQAGRFVGLENAAISPDGSILATVGSQTIKLWRLSDRTLIATLGSGVGAQGVAFSHDGAKLATVDEGDRLVRLWDITTGRLQREFTGHADGVFAVAFATDDRTLISAGADATIRFWDVTTGNQIGVHSGHIGRVWNLALSPDGHTLASAGRDGSVKLWNSRPSLDHVRLPISKPVCFELLDDGRTLMTLESGVPWQIGRWDVHSGSLLERKPISLGGEYPSAAFSRDGRWLAFSDQDGRLTLWNIATGKRRDIIEPRPEKLILPSFSSDSRFLGFHHEWSQLYTLLDHGNDREIPFPYDQVLGTIFTPSSEMIALLVDGSVCRWDPLTGRSKRLTPRHPYLLRGYRAISADGRILASTDPETRKIYVCSAETLELIKELPAQPATVGPLAFSPDGRTLASSVGNNRTVKLWDIRTGEELLSLGGYSGWVSGLRFSSDGRILATISEGGPQNPNEIFLWSAGEVEPQSDQSPSINSPY